MSEAQKIILSALPTGGPTGSGLSLADVVRSAIPPGGQGEVWANLTSQLKLLGTATEQQVGALAANTQALTLSATSQSGGAASATGNVAKSAVKWLTGGLTMAPLVSAVVGLFKKEKPESVPLPTYTLPPAIHLEGALPSQFSGPTLAVDYGQDGLPRAVPASARYSGPPIAIQVQAIDSRSFLDHSSEIAGAVRQAILNGHVLTDVVNEF